MKNNKSLYIEGCLLKTGGYQPIGADNGKCIPPKEESEFNSKFIGIPIEITENGDLVFHCKADYKAKALFKDLLTILKKARNENEKKEKTTTTIMVELGQR